MTNTADHADGDDLRNSTTPYQSKRRKEIMATKKILSAVTVAFGSLIVALVLIFSSSIALAQADHVRWDILSIPSFPITTFNPGGEAFAFAYNTPGNPSAAKIRLTGAGTFVAPASGGPSGAVTGGGTWETSGEGLPEDSGTYRVTKLVSWEFASSQIGTFTDNIGDVAERANGTAVFLIEYDDGSEGMLGVACHGPGAPNGIFEGVIATKGYVTYWNGELPAPGVDKNRTLFHVRQ